MPGIKRGEIVDTIETSPGVFEPIDVQDRENLGRAVTEVENARVLTMMAAIYLKNFRFPNLTVIEVFKKMEDVEFVKAVIKEIVMEEEREDIN